MKQIARNYVWWAALDEDIERAVRACAACRAVRPAPPPAPLHSWPWPAEPWARLHVDYLGPLDGKHYLVVVDAHSKWIEAERVSSTAAATLIACFRRMFARFGLPKRIVSDNGPPFSSAELADYLRRNGIKHNLTAPYHPASNGAAENAVRSVKRALKKAAIENVSDETALSRFLFAYRNTEHATTGREPAVALLGRRLRGRLDLLRPDAAELVRDRQLDSERRSDARERHALPGDAVLLRDYSRRNQKWAEGVVLARESPVSYTVKASDGRVHKRHVDQLVLDKNRKSRFSLTNITTPDGSAVEGEDDGEEKVEEVPSDRSPRTLGSSSSLKLDGDTDEVVSPPAEPNRARRQAALQCLQKINNRKLF